MKNVLTTLCAVLFAAMAAVGQPANFFKPVTASEIWLPEKSETVAMPDEYLTYSLDFVAMREHLRLAPAEGSAQAKAGAVQIALPMPDGKLETFKVWESSVMHPELAAKFPTIKTYAGMGISNPALTVRFGFGEDGFHAIIPGNEGGSLVMPYASAQTQFYVCFKHSNFMWEGLDLPPVFIQKVPMPGEETADLTLANEDEELNLRGGDEGALATLHIYQFALACTYEYSQGHGGTMSSVMSSLVTATNTLNSVLERDLDIRLVLIPNNDLLIFLNVDDPYQNSNMGGALLEQNEDILNQKVGLSNFDVGHCFTGCCSDVGGVVSGSVCSQGKARGVTCHCSSNVVGTTLSIAAHEMGHQFSAGHTFSHCPGSEGQFHSSSAYEPGSGSTILSYQGACGSSNIPGNSNIHYHGGTIEEFWSYTRDGGGNLCVTEQETSNHSPAVELPYANGFYIPISTPFEMEAIASDEDGDPLTYCWEQKQSFPGAWFPLGTPVNDSPTFRSFDPSTSPWRIFPRLSTILNNQTSNVELLPTYSRNLGFRCTVRDNNVAEGTGGVTWQDVTFDATETAGPFLVTNPNLNTVVWKAGDEVEVTWDVANTDNNKVNCQGVNIFLSVDGGQTYPHQLASFTPNDGSEIVSVPDVASNTARIKVKAANNIFFDLSNQNFQIQPAETAGYTMSVSPQWQQVCVPNEASLEVLTGSVLDFSDPVTLAVTAGLPAGVGISFSQNPVVPGESSVLKLDMSDVTADGDFEVTLQAVAGTDTTYRSLFFKVVYSDFSALQLLTPTSGQSSLGLLPDFTWTPLPNADLYDFQLSTSPNFEQGTIVDEAYNFAAGSYTPDVSLTESQIYFWRVRPSNICTEADWSDAQTFQTFTVTCAPFVSNDVPKNISNVGTPTIESSLPILQNSVITDMNVGKIKGQHDALPDLKVTLVSPAGTEVVLFDQVCGNVSTFDFGLDDQAPFEIACPPINGLSYKPQNPLAAFVGENTVGNWVLRVQVVNALGQGGNLSAWNLEFCAAVNANNPFLINNEPLLMQPGGSYGIYENLLLVEDTDNNADQLQYTIVAAPKYGFLTRNGAQLVVGNHFTQGDIHTGKLGYTNLDPNVTGDYFTFIVEDGTGGWLGTPKFSIVIDPNAPSGTDEESLENQVSVFPNPASDVLNVVFKNALTADAELFVTDVQGKLLKKQTLSSEEQVVQIATGEFAAGLYFLNVRTDEGVFAKRFVVN
ncbi:MAG: reprolysin-like metallopeptidase [Bacteroidota bacterium]